MYTQLFLFVLLRTKSGNPFIDALGTVIAGFIVCGVIALFKYLGSLLFKKGPEDDNETQKPSPDEEQTSNPNSESK